LLSAPDGLPWGTSQARWSAEFERNLIRERTVAGLTAARARGRNRGRPVKLSPKEVKTTRALLKTADIHVGESAARFGIARSPFTAQYSGYRLTNGNCRSLTLESELNLFGALCKKNSET
jgi:hypothetical protein